MVKEQTLVWVDLEMTGLNPEIDTILEIAVIVTDNNLKIIKEGPSLVIHADDAALARMHPEVKAMHASSGLTNRVKESTITLAQAQQEVMVFLKQYAQPKSPLCGNSIWLDKTFLIKHMPEITNFLHYRIIDVSTVKELVLRWYSNDAKANFAKAKNHRALDDIRESIAELIYYRKNYFLN
jgi:oligoribonuclease